MDYELQSELFIQMIQVVNMLTDLGREHEAWKVIDILEPMMAEKNAVAVSNGEANLVIEYR